MTTKITSLRDPGYISGPWNMIEAKTLIHIETDASHPMGAGRHICSVPKKDIGNAHLLWSSPDLLTALLKMVADVGASPVASATISDATLKAVYAAIAKAEGRAA